MIIVANHWNEDLEWLKKSKYPVVIIDKVGSAPSCFEPAMVLENKGGAESSYFKYIIENYENLPDNVAFLHGHETAYHQRHPRSLLEVIEGANLSHGYIPLNGWVRAYKFFNEVGTMNAPQLWDDLKLPQELKPRDGSLMMFQPNSQFIVSKERIRRFSKEHYEHMYKVLIDEEKEWCPHSKMMIARHYAMLENIFHIMYGEGRFDFYNPSWFRFDYFPEPWGGHPEHDAQLVRDLMRLPVAVLEQKFF